MSGIALAAYTVIGLFGLLIVSCAILLFWPVLPVKRIWKKAFATALALQIAILFLSPILFNLFPEKLVHQPYPEEGFIDTNIVSRVLNFLLPRVIIILSGIISICLFYCLWKILITSMHKFQNHKK